MFSGYILRDVNYVVCVDLIVSVWSECWFAYVVVYLMKNI